MLNMKRKMDLVWLVGITLAYPLLAYGDTLEPKIGFQKVTVYQDKPSANQYVISGYMPDGRCVEMDDVWRQDCQEGRSCIKAVYKRECSTAFGSGWAGVYWLQPANNWGDLNGGLNLTGASRLAFWARGEKGGEVVLFKMGGVGMAKSFPDSAVAATEPITLTKEWKEYSMDLEAKDLTRIIGGFAWVGTAKQNQGDITFFLDNIRYE